MDWVWHVSPGLQGQWFNELLSKMTLQMESLLLPFLTPSDLFIPAHHPDQGLAAKEASKESIEGWKMKRSTRAGEIYSSGWKAQGASPILPVGQEPKPHLMGASSSSGTRKEQQLQLTPHCSPCHRHHLIYTRARGCDSVTQSQLLCWPSPGPCIQNTLQMKCEDNMLYHGHLLPVIVV